MKKFIIILAIVAALGTAAFFYYKKQIGLIEDMDFDVIGVTTDSLSLTGQTIVLLKVKLTSQSKLQAEISDLNLDIYVNDIKVGVINDVKTLLIPARGFSIVDFKITIESSEVATNAVDLIAYWFNHKDASMSFRGYAKIKIAGINIPFPYTYNTTAKELIGI